MRSKFISIGLTFLMVGLVFANIVSAGDLAPPDDGIDGIQYIVDDWAVSGAETYTDEVIILTGNLTVPAGESLTLVNTTILMNCTTDGEFWINISGTLNMFDGGDGLSPMDAGDSDASVISVNNTGIETLMRVKAGANFNAYNSEIHSVGYMMNAPTFYGAGILIKTNNAVIENCLIADNYCGLIFDSCFPDTLAFNEITRNIGRGLWITNITNPAYNINGVLSDNSILENGGYGALITAPNINIEVFNMNVSENSYGLTIIANNSLTANVHHNQVWRNTGGSHTGNSIHLLTNGTGTINAVVEFNEVMENTCGGLWIGYEYDGIATNHTTALIANNTFIGNDGGECIQGNASINAKIVDNYFGGSSYNSHIDTIAVGHKNTDVTPANKFCDYVTIEFSRNQLINDNAYNMGGAFKVAGLQKINATVLDNYIQVQGRVGGALRIGHPGESNYGYAGDFAIVHNLDVVVKGNTIIGSDEPTVGGYFDFHAVNNVDIVFSDNYVASDSDDGATFLRIGWWGSSYGDPSLFVNASVENNTFLNYPDDYCALGGFVFVYAQEYVDLKFNNNHLEFLAYDCGGPRMPGFLVVGDYVKNLTTEIIGNTIRSHDHYGGYITSNFIVIIAEYNTEVYMRDNIITITSDDGNCGAYYGALMEIGGYGSSSISEYTNFTFINNYVSVFFGYDGSGAGGGVKVYGDEIEVLMNDNTILDASPPTSSYQDSSYAFGVRIGYICGSNGIDSENVTVISNNNTIGPGGKDCNLRIGAIENLYFTSNGDEFVNAWYDCTYDPVLSAGNGLTLEAKNITASITDAYVHHNQGIGICVISELDATVDIIDSVISHNSWNGIYLESLSGIMDASIKNTDITWNGANIDGDHGELGSGIWCKEASLDIVNCSLNNPTGDVEIDINGISDVTTLNTTFEKDSVFIEGVTPAILEGNVFEEDIFTEWTPIADGSFRITIDGDTQNIDGIDFVGDGDMGAVALTIEAALRLIGTGGYEFATCVWNGTQFNISSGTTGLSTSISVLSTSTGTVGTDLSGNVASTNGFWIGGQNGTTTTGTGSSLLVQWYLHVKAEQLSSGLGLPLTDIDMSDLGGSIVDSGVTGLDGYRRWLIADEFYQTTTVKTVTTPHTVDATKSPESGSAGPITMDESKEVTIVLDYDTLPPTADAGADQTISEDTYAILDGSGSSDDWQITDWSWACSEFNGTMNGETVNFTFENPGVFSVILTVTDFEGFTDTDEVNITVTDEVIPIADAGSDMTVNEDTVVAFDGSGSTDNAGVANYTWTFGTVTLYGVAPTYTFQPGTFDVLLTVSDADGNSDTDSLIVTVLDITDPIVDAGIGSDCAECLTVIFDSSGSSDNVGIVSYIWTFNDGANDIVLSGALLNYSFTLLGNKTITLTCTDAAGNVGTGTTWVNVIDVTDPSVLVVAPGESLSGVPIDWALVIVFDEPMNQDSVEEAFSIEGASVTGFEWDSSGRYVTVSLEDLDFETDYVFTVNSTAEDVAGNPLSDEHSGSFTTITGPVEADSPSFLEDYWWIFIVIALVVVIMFQAMKGGSKEPAAPVEEETPSEESTEETPAEEPAPEAEPETEPEVEAEPAEEELVE